MMPDMNPSYWKWWHKMLGVFVLIGALHITQDIVGMNKPRPPTAAEIQSKLPAIAETLRGKLPMKMDEITTAVDIYVHPNDRMMMVYVYRVDARASEFTEQDRTEMQREAINTFCTTEKTRPLLNAGVKFNHFYYDRSEKFIFNVEASKADCDPV